MTRAPHKSTPLHLALALAALLVALLATACSTSPQAPDYDNPFDPEGPTGGDGLALNAAIFGGSIRLTWQQPQGMGIAEYAIQHSFSRDTGYGDPIIVEHTTDATNTYIYADAEPTRTHWFRIQATTLEGDFTIVAYASPAGATTGPRVILGDGSGRTPTRYVEARVVVSQGTSLAYRLGPDFSVETVVPAAAAGDTAYFTIDLGEAAQDSSITVRVIAYGDSFTSTPTDVDVKVDFTPDFALAGGGTKVASRTPTLTVPTTGMVAMRFALSEEALSATAWLPPAATYSGLELSASTAAQRIWGEFESDLGFTSAPASISLTPDLLTGAGFRLALPQDHVTDTSLVEAVFTGARATLMRYAATPDLAGAPWQAFDDTFTIDLGPAAGLTTIYAQARNDWADSPILTDYAIHIALGAEVEFLAPADGVDVLGGFSLLVRGRAGGGTATLDSVKVDLGDGAGFRAPAGLEDWTLTWDVPAVDAATVRALRARAWTSAGAVVDSATATVTVTIQP